MIHKSYLIEQNFDNLKNKIVLFYGENLGLIDDFKDEIVKRNKNVLKFSQDEILKNDKIIFDEINNVSLFDDKKIIFIINISDKFLNIIEDIQLNKNGNLIYLFSEILEKKSKIRRHFEDAKDLDIVPCYKDNETTIKKIISYKLKGYSGLNPQIISKIIENGNLERSKINNELDKIKTLFINKKIDVDLLDQLLNLEADNEFENVKDSAISGNKSKTNKLLSTTVFETEKMPLYLTILNQRLNKLKEVTEKAKIGGLSNAIEKIRPPIFWKDKKSFTDQAHLWSFDRLNTAISKTYNAEINIKSNTEINKNLLIKKLLLDICLLANA
ncbi:hypothetical protein OAY20_00770 [Candidatus Pelagibacter bacterium]|nr:hypothetical protein [Candidatus Pelagibacter bacterium]